MQIPLLSIFVVFMRAGLLTVGGGYSMLPVLHFELVATRSWIGEQQFADVVSKATTVPGAVAANTAFLFGRLLRGRSGSAVAVIGVSLPAFTTMLIVAGFLTGFLGRPLVGRFMRGAAAAVTAQIAYGGWLYVRSAVRHPVPVLAAAVLFAGLVFLTLHPLVVVGISLLVGFPISYVRSAQEQRAKQDEDYTHLMG